MKNYHRLASMIFNQPLAVTDQMLDMAVAWANRAMNLNIINLSANRSNVEPAAMEDDGPAPAMSATERRSRAAAESGVYVVPVHGLLVSRSAHVNPCESMTSYESIRTMLRAGVDDPAVEHIVLDIDSPGGSAMGCADLADDIFNIRAIKPVTAIANFSAFSAAYWLGSAASQLIVSRSSGVGSIGVIARHLDLSAKLSAEGVKVTPVYAGARKNDLNSAEPLSEEGMSFLRSMVADMYDQFAEGVARNRGLPVAKVKDTEAGVYFGRDAVAHGLADMVDSPQAAIDRIAAEVAAQRGTGGTRRSISARASAMAAQNRL